MFNISNKDIQKGELYELKNMLNSKDQEKVKSAVTKIIELMTVGEDLSELFPDVVRSISTSNLELKKMVYLYTIHYAHRMPEKAIMIVNTFQRDAKSHPNALIRALAIRTMGCINVDKITEHLCDPLSDALSDSDPYVRKTAVICVAKLNFVNQDLLVEKGFIDRLFLALSDSNPMVVSNAVGSICEIAKNNKTLFTRISAENCKRLVSAIGECTEWGQVMILDLLAECHETISDPLYVVERVIPRMSHANGAVVLSSIKVVVLLMGRIKQSNVYNKIRPSLITLLSSKNELQYVVLRNFKKIVNNKTDLFKDDARVFFCKYNDPPYIKAEKIKILVLIADENSFENILLELNDYAREVDVGLSEIGIRAIGELGLKIRQKLPECLSVFCELFELKQHHVCNLLVVVVKDVLLEAPNIAKAEKQKILNLICSDVSVFDRQDTVEALVWLVGEFCEEISVYSLGVLEEFFEDFGELDETIKYQLLTASVKCYLKVPKNEQKLFLDRVMSSCLNSENQDLIERANFYKELVHKDFFMAKSVITRPPVEEPKSPKQAKKTHRKNRKTLKEQKSISSISSVQDEFVLSERLTRRICVGELDRVCGSSDGWKLDRNEICKKYLEHYVGQELRRKKSEIRGEPNNLREDIGEEETFVDDESEPEVEKSLFPEEKDLLDFNGFPQSLGDAWAN